MANSVDDSNDGKYLQVCNAFCGYICIQTKNAWHIMFGPDAEGYKCISRPNVPFSKTAEDALAVCMKIYPDWKDVLCIPIKVEEERIIRSNGSLAVKGTHLAAQHFVFQPLQQRKNHAHETCPFCHTNPETADYENENDPLREKIGLKRYYIRNREYGFASSPCQRDECVKKMIKRSTRLREGREMTLYHQTTRENIENILNGGGFLRGRWGAAAAGIYLAQTPRETEWKADQQGGVIEVVVRLGNPLQEGRTKHDVTFAIMQNDPDGPYDSVILDRSGKNVYPVPDVVPGTRVENLNIGDDVHPGYEFVVYSWDQVTVLGEVKRDIIPPEYKLKKVDGITKLVGLERGERDPKPADSITTLCVSPIAPYSITTPCV